MRIREFLEHAYALAKSGKKFLGKDMKRLVRIARLLGVSVDGRIVYKDRFFWHDGLENDTLYPFYRAHAIVEAIFYDLKRREQHA